MFKYLQLTWLEAACPLRQRTFFLKTDPFTKCPYLTWRSVTRTRSDAEVWTSRPVASGPAAGRAALWTPRPTRTLRPRAGPPTAVRRWWPRCWAAERTERRSLRPWCSWWPSNECGRQLRLALRCVAAAVWRRSVRHSERSGCGGRSLFQLRPTYLSDRWAVPPSSPLLRRIFFNK